MSIDQPTTGVLRYDGVHCAASLRGSPFLQFVFVRPFVRSVDPSPGPRRAPSMFVAPSFCSTPLYPSIPLIRNCPGNESRWKWFSNLLILMGSRCRDSVLCDSHSARKWRITQWNSEHTSIIHFKRTAIKRHVTQYTQQAGNTLNYPLSPNRLTHTQCTTQYLIA